MSAAALVLVLKMQERLDELEKGFRAWICTGGSVIEWQTGRVAECCVNL